MREVLDRQLNESSLLLTSLRRKRDAENCGHDLMLSYLRSQIVDVNFLLRRVIDDKTAAVSYLSDFGNFPVISDAVIPAADTIFRQCISPVKYVMSKVGSESGSVLHNVEFTALDIFQGWRRILVDGEVKRSWPIDSSRRRSYSLAELGELVLMLQLKFPFAT